MSEKMIRDSFVFYRSFFVAISQLPKKYQLDTYQALARYALDSDEISLNGISAAVLELCKPQIDANNRRFENGKKGGRPNQTETKAEPKPNQTETKAEPNVNVNVNDNVNDNVNANENKRACRFAPPTLDDVKAYCFERGNNVDPQRFIDYYQSNGWKVGKNPMKDWKAAVRTWEQRDAAPKKEDNDKEIRQQYENARNLYPLETKRDEGLDLFMKKAKGDAKIARRLTDKIGELVEMYYNGDRCLQTFEKDIEVAYADIRH